MEKYYDILTNIISFAPLVVFLYIPYALHKQDKQFEEYERKHGLYIDYKELK